MSSHSHCSDQWSHILCYYHKRELIPEFLNQTRLLFSQFIVEIFPFSLFLRCLIRAGPHVAQDAVWHLHDPSVSPCCFHDGFNRICSEFTDIFLSFKFSFWSSSFHGRSANAPWCCWWWSRTASLTQSWFSPSLSSPSSHIQCLRCDIDGDIFLWCCLDIVFGIRRKALSAYPPLDG